MQHIKNSYHLNRHNVRFILCLLMIFGFVSMVSAAALPQSDWYAVTWVEASDTLHWVNENGEQVSIPRPQLEGEISQAQTRLHISPNGRTLIVISPLLNGHEGIGFYDIAIGDFVQIHETQDNEIILPVTNHAFTETSSHFAVTLRHPNTGAWRMIAFEAGTGNALTQLTSDDPSLPNGVQNNPDLWADVVQFNLDEAFNVLEVRFQTITNSNVIQTSFPSFVWRIPVNNPESVGVDTLTYSQLAGFDIHPMTGEIVYAWFDPQLGQTQQTPQEANTIRLVSGDQEQTLVTQGGEGGARLPRWLHNGDWVGYYTSNGALAWHWSVMTRDTVTQTPLSPAIIDVYHTNDGFLTKNTTLWALNHVTTLNFEGFSEPGNTIFAPGSAFAVIYTTPANTPFTLTEVAAPSISDLVADDLQAPQTNACSGAPAPRLMINSGARVTFTDGTDLNIRTAPAGEYIMQIPEGTEVMVIEGPVCVNEFNWWNIQLQSEDVTVGGWAAEGDLSDYYLEPYTSPVVNTDAIQQVPLEPTNPPRADLTATLACGSNPTVNLSVGMFVNTVTDGTLAMRTNINDTTPSHQVPDGILAEIIDGPQCRGGLRMWVISGDVNGQTLTGWVADGYMNTIYLAPASRR